MNNLNVLSTRKKSSVTRLTRNSKIFKTIIKAIQDKKGENIISLDLRKIPEAVADFFIICQANSNTQIKAIADAKRKAQKVKMSQNYKNILTTLSRPTYLVHL